ncbi:SDR family oxidoreductase [Nitrospina watsonii]|uniref:NAD(P)-bd_dom domain-containing protein n=1 Tax=Nitrospina watsonii TaxID=1323948 RepID=A0ABM9HFZ9_9BACT|nr:SDR family oxidoreductase [Nitrospina watsonii]CAI2718963.1 NAD(P)-bd_dom domain-containing protein [Nitrospina watsonii]
MDPEKVNYHYCDDLPTQPLPAGTSVLVTGANGYVARRLVPELLHRGYRVRCMLRNRVLTPILEHPNLEYVYADALDKDSLRDALSGMQVAYYLIHSLRLEKKKFTQAEKIAARNFKEAAEECALKKIIYLGGLGEECKDISWHLKSRMEVGTILSEARMTVVHLRAAIIIGTGSASYEMLKSMILHMRWIPFLPEFNSLCQPIAIRDVIKYLVGVLETEDIATGKYPIGGPDTMTYREMVLRFAGLFDRKVRFFDVSWVPLPVNLLCRIFSFWLHLFISVPINITCLLLESLRTDVVVTDNRIRKVIPFEPLDFETAVRWAFEKEANSRVFSHWSDVPPEDMADLMPLAQYESAQFLFEEHDRVIPASLERTFQMVCRIGGPYGWLHGNSLWKVRGLIDRLLGGVGLNRGRRDLYDLRIGDSVDCWRVENLEPGKELLLRAELISPGYSWLQFVLEPVDAAHTRLILRAHFIPMPVWGHLYWYTLSRFHTYIFRGMLNHFEREARVPEAPQTAPVGTAKVAPSPGMREKQKSA